MFCYEHETRQKHGPLAKVNPSVCGIKKASCHVLKVAEKVSHEDEKNHWFVLPFRLSNRFRPDTRIPKVIL